MPSIYERKQRIAKICDEAIDREKEKDDIRAVIQYRHIDWKSTPSTTITSISTKVDNVLRNFAHAHGVTGSNALKYFFETVGSKVLEHLEESYEQRQKYADWRAYKHNLQNGKLTRKEKKLDKAVRKFFDDGYGRNTPSIAA